MCAAQSHAPLHRQGLDVQAAGKTTLMACLIRKGADVSKIGTKLASTALQAHDDRLLGALIIKVKQSVLDTLDLSYRQLVAEKLPHAAAQYLLRTMEDPGALRTPPRTLGQGAGAVVVQLACCTAAIAQVVTTRAGASRSWCMMLGRGHVRCAWRHQVATW